MRPSPTLLALFACFAATSAIAQDTDTEKAVARDIIARMTTLQQTLNIPAIVTQLTGPNAARDAVAARARELWETELQAMADDITRHPEVGFTETRSVKILTDYLKAHGFTVTDGVAGLKTAWVARFVGAAGGPGLGLIAEYDALRGTKGAFHGDQHSAQGPVALAAAVAVAEFLAKTKTPGTVIVYGTPAEEMMPPNVKEVMHDSAVFKEADVIVRSHSSTSTTRTAPGFGTCCLNINATKYTFGGAPAHQMMAWNGRDALSAAILLFNHIDAIRKNIRPEARIQGILPEGGAAPNVVPDRAVVDMWVRYPDEPYLEQISAMVDDAARAAALATGTKVKIDHYGKARDGISQSTLAEVAFAYIKKYGAIKVDPLPGKPQGFEETGTVSRVIPGAEFSAHTSNGAFHTYEMEADALTEVGHRGFLADAQGMAALLHDFATRPAYRTAVKTEFDGLKALYGEYQSLLRSAYATPKVLDPE